VGNLEIPYGVSLEGLLEVVGSWNRADAAGLPLSAKEVAEKARFKTKTIERQQRFMLQLGLLQKKGRKYSLTEAGAQVCRLADYQQTEDFYSKVRNLLTSWSELLLVLEFVRRVGTIAREKLVSRIVMYSGRPSGDKNAVTGAETLVDLLEKAGVTSQENGEVWIAKNTQTENDRLMEAESDRGEDMAKSTEVSRTVLKGKKEGGKTHIRVTVEVWHPGQERDDRWSGFIDRFREALLSLGIKEDSDD